MNMSFKYDKGDKKVIVSDENGELTEREYFDNIDELLIQENIIDIIQKNILENSKEREKLLKEINSLEQEIKKQKDEEDRAKREKSTLKRNTLKNFFWALLAFTILNVFLVILAKEKTLTKYIYALSCSIFFPVLNTCYYFLRNIKKLYEPPFHYYSIDELEETLKMKREELILAIQEKKVLVQTLEKETKKYKELQETQSRNKEMQMQIDNQITKVEYLERLEQIRKEINDMLEVPTTEYDNNQTLAIKRI